MTDPFQTVILKASSKACLLACANSRGVYNVQKNTQALELTLERGQNLQITWKEKTPVLMD